MIVDNAQERTPRYRGVSYTQPIDEAKRLVPVVDLADLLCGAGGLRRIGAEWVGRCPLPDHEDRTPSFTVNPEKNAWFCHGCVRGGDVVELARLAWDYSQREATTAAATLLLEFGHEIPPRPPAWYRKQERQKPVRDRIDAEKVEHVRLLLYRLVWMPWLKRLPESVRNEASDNAWERSLPLARMLYEQRRGA
jgi:hypothetical protein